MFDSLEKKSAVPNGPDFTAIDSRAKADRLLEVGDLEKLFLLPVEFGGTDDPRNVVYVPRGFVEIKRGIDLNIIRPLVESRKITAYEATPEYQGESLVPIAIKIVASNPGSFNTDINIWGKALLRKS